MSENFYNAKQAMPCIDCRAYEICGNGIIKRSEDCLGLRELRAIKEIDRLRGLDIERPVAT